MSQQLVQAHLTHSQVLNVAANEPQRKQQTSFSASKFRLPVFDARLPSSSLVPLQLKLYEKLKWCLQEFPAPMISTSELQPLVFKRKEKGRWILDCLHAAKPFSESVPIELKISMCKLELEIQPAQIPSAEIVTLPSLAQIEIITETKDAENQSSSEDEFLPHLLFGSRTSISFSSGYSFCVLLCQPHEESNEQFVDSVGRVVTEWVHMHTGLPEQHIMSGGEGSAEQTDLVFKKVQKRVVILEWKELNTEELLRRIRELPDTQAGALVVTNVPHDAAKDLAKYQHRLPLHIIWEPVLYDVWEKPSYRSVLASMLWGNAKHDEQGSFDELFGQAKQRYHKLLDVLETSKYALITKPHESPDGDQNGRESREHFLLKTFVVRHLVENEKVRIEDIETEKPIPNGIGDVLQGKTAYEVETLYTTGLPLKKIDKSIDKYKGTQYNVKLVLPNLSLLILGHALWQRIKYYREEWGMNVEVFGIGIEKGSLFPYCQIRHEVRKLLQMQNT